MRSLRIVAAVDYGPWNVPAPERLHVEDAAEQFPSDWRVSCDEATRNIYLVSVRDDRNQIRALGSFAPADVRLMIEFLRMAAHHT